MMWLRALLQPISLLVQSAGLYIAQQKATDLRVESFPALALLFLAHFPKPQFPHM